MIIMLFDMYEHRLRDIDTVESCVHTLNDEENTCSISAYGVPDAAEYAAFKDVDGVFQLFVIASRETDIITRKQVLYCESAAYELATDQPLADVRPTNLQAGAAVTMALNGTRWSLGTTIETATKSARWFYITPHAALQSVVETWGVRLRPRVTVSGANITGHYIDVLSPTPIWRGKRFEIGKDVLTSKFTIDKRNVATAIVPRGKGEESGDGYTTRLSIAGVAWSTANGDPADKPLNQTYIEKPDATALYGIGGTRPRVAVKVYEDITDAGELLQAAWDDLQAASTPLISGNATAFDLERVGFPHEAARVNDCVAFISDGLRYTTTIVGIKREYAQNGKDVFTFGALNESSIRQLYGIQRTLNTVNDKANAGAQIAQHNPDLLRGIIDTAVTTILSSVTRRYTDTDGGDVYETADQSKAVKLTGAGILCASSRVGDVWQWETAIDGSGIVASMITSGVLQASLVRILGTDRFYWDSSNITIIDTTDGNKQIRIGLYDGSRYGIGFTQDGGEIWQNAIGFDGLTIQAGSVTQEMLDPDIDLGSTTVYYDIDPPSEPKTGDIWYDTGNGLIKRYETHVWVDITTEALKAAIDAAADAQSTADGKIKTYAQASAPTGLTATDVGDLWFDTDDNNKPYRWNGSAWVACQDIHLDSIVTTHTTQIAANATAITLKASQSSLDTLSGRVTTAEGQITVQAGQIALKVSAGDIASSINQTAQSVLINAAKINLAGYVTITSLGSGGTTAIDGARITTGTIAANRLDLSGVLTATDVGANGSTVISGARITTGKVAAARIDVDNLYVKHLSAADGVFKGTLTCADNANYSINIATVDGYQQPSLYPNQPDTGNVGTRVHYFDIMFASKFTVPSSLKIKKNIQDLKDDDYDISEIRPITYEAKSRDTGERFLGFIAEELNESCPLAVVRGEDDNEPCGVDYARISVIAIREIQKLMAEVQDLRARVAALESLQN